MGRSTVSARRAHSRRRQIGFETVDYLGTPTNEELPKGFRRPIFCATKPVSPTNANAAGPPSQKRAAEPISASADAADAAPAAKRVRND